jgi:hypothetical protein
VGGPQRHDAEERGGKGKGEWEGEGGEDRSVGFEECWDRLATKSGKRVVLVDRNRYRDVGRAAERKSSGKGGWEALVGGEEGEAGEGEEGGEDGEGVEVVVAGWGVGGEGEGVVGGQEGAGVRGGGGRAFYAAMGLDLPAHMWQMHVNMQVPKP